MSSGDVGLVVTGIWQEVLGVDRVDPEDNFFERGGQSLAAMRVITRLNRVTGVRMKLIDLFRAPALRDFILLAESRLAEGTPGT